MRPGGRPQTSARVRVPGPIAVRPGERLGGLGHVQQFAQRAPARAGREVDLEEVAAAFEVPPCPAHLPFPLLTPEVLVDAEEVPLVLTGLAAGGFVLDVN